MHEDVESLCLALDDIAGEVLNGYGNDGTLMEKISWQFPALTRNDLHAIPSRLARDIRQCSDSDIPNTILGAVNESSRRIEVMKSIIVPNLYKEDDGVKAIQAYIVSFDILRKELAPLLSCVDWGKIGRQATDIENRIEAINSSIRQSELSVAEIGTKIQFIGEAHKDALAMSTDINIVKKLNKKIHMQSEETARLAAEVVESHSKATEVYSNLQSIDSQSSVIMQRCNELLKIATTTGLANAFADKEKRLKWSMRLWTFALALALAAGAYVVYLRIEAFTVLLNSQSFTQDKALAHAVLSISFVGAPVWVSWLATKRIGHYFRLAEDYGYKVAMARAYEGYKKEAIDLDQKLASQLFTSAILMLNDHPLRLIERATPGSPFHEFVNSRFFRKAFAVFCSQKTRNT